MGSEQWCLTPLCRACQACRAPRENQGRLDFELQYRESGAFARTMTSNFQQHPEDGHKVAQKGSHRYPKTAKGIPKRRTKGAKRGPKDAQASLPGLFRLTFWPRFYHSQNYKTHQLEKNHLGAFGPASCTEFRCASCWHSHLIRSVIFEKKYQGT